ncbi:MAG: glycosyltransferase family 4 protein [Acidobacteria bacterium]|nr:glycosyltransferase family 4 protein [Acidobacteriota bacterium]
MPRPHEPRLLILSQYFPPEMGAPQVRLSELGERLLDRGWAVEVLTALPNYPTGRVFPGYAKLRPVVEEVGRLRTVRVPLWPSKTGFAKRLVSYFTFAGAAALWGPGRCRTPDLLWVESPPLFIGYAARHLSWRWRRPYVLNVSDLWPESAIRMGIVREGFLTRRAQDLERSLYEHAAGVTGQSREIVEAVARTSPGTPTRLITNGVDPRRFGPEHADDEARALLGAGGGRPGPVFLYAGLLGWAQGLDQVLDLAKTLPPEVPGRFVLVGDGPERERLLARLETEGIDRVTILPAQPRERIPALLGAADAAIITLGMAIPGAVPSKIYEAMASALPILLVAGGEPARRVEDAGAGLAVPAGDADALRDAFLRLAENPDLRAELGAAARRTAETTYDRDVIADQLHDFLSGLLETRSGRRGSAPERRLRPHDPPS